MQFTSTKSVKGFRIAILFTCTLLLFECSTPRKELPKEMIPSTILQAKNFRPLIDTVFESTPERIARGEYLAGGLYCMSCHTEKDTTKAGWPPIVEGKFAGALRYKTDSTYLYAPNLTPDKETGIGNFTDDMLARAIREGVGHDGRSLVPPGRGGMPWTELRDLTDEDLASIIVYLRSIPAIKNEIPPRNIGQTEEELIVGRSYPLTTKATHELSSPLERGRYLIHLTGCGGCHTGWNKRNPGIFGGGINFGDKEKPIFSPNISSDPTGLGGYSEEAFISTIRNGKGKSGELNHHMPWVDFRNLSDEDLSAILTALQQSYPVKHIVLNSVPASYCEVCEQEHGAGSANIKEPLNPFKEDFILPKDLAGTFISTKFNRDTAKIYYVNDSLRFSWRSGSKEWKLIPLNDSTYLADGFIAPLEFIREGTQVNRIDLQGFGLPYVKLY